jgi:hypothetical protein
VALDLVTVVLEANLDLAVAAQHLAYQAVHQFAQVGRLVGVLYPPGQEAHLADVLQASAFVSPAD